MKLTWFGNSTFRIHIGGQVVVVDAGAAPAGVDCNELVSGAEMIVALAEAKTVTDLVVWKPRPRERLLDAADQPRPAQVFWGGEGALVINADEDMPLLLVAGPVPELGRWAERAVVVLAGHDLATRGEQLVAARVPRLVALAGSDAELGSAFGRLPAMLDGAGLIALEPGLALEV